MTLETTWVRPSTNRAFKTNEPGNKCLMRVMTRRKVQAGQFLFDKGSSNVFPQL